jgi:hypothetical protein
VGDDCLKLFETRASRPETVVIDRPVHGSGAVRNGDGWLALARRAVALVVETMTSNSPATVRVMVLEPPSPVAASTAARLYRRLLEEEELEEEHGVGNSDDDDDDAGGHDDETITITPTIRLAAVLPRPSAPLALMSRGRTTGLVVDVGEGGAWAAPVVDGDALPLGARRSAAGGALAAEWALEAVLRPAARRRQMQDGMRRSPPLPSCAWWAAEVEEQDEDEEEEEGEGGGGGGKRRDGFGGNGGSSGGGAGWTIPARLAPSAGGEGEDGGRSGGGGTSGAGGPSSSAAQAALAFLRARKDAGALAVARAAVAAHRPGTLERLALLERGRFLAWRSAAREQASAVAVGAVGGGGGGGSSSGTSLLHTLGDKEKRRPGGEGQHSQQPPSRTSQLPLLLSPSLAGADGPGVAAVAASAVREGAGVDLRRPLLGCVLLTGGVGAALGASLASAVRSELARQWPALPVRVLSASGGSEGGEGGGVGGPAVAGWAVGAHAAFAGAASLAESLLERAAPCCEAEGWLMRSAAPTAAAAPGPTAA